MTTKSNTKTDTHASNTHSSLAKFQLAFEYDRTWSEAKQTVQHRPTKK